MTLILLLVATMASAGCLRTFEEPTNVRIVNIDVAPDRVLAAEVLLNVTSYLDNRGGGESREVRLLVKAYDESTGFLVTQLDTSVGRLRGDTTTPVTQQITVPREGAIRIDVTLFTEDLRQQSAQLTARNLGALKPQVFATGLTISEIDFIVREANSTRPAIESALYFTNEADSPSEDLRVQVKAREVTTRLVADTMWLQTGVIEAGTTVIRSVTLHVPEGHNYVVEILTWRGDVIVDRAEGIVRLAPTMQIPKDQELVVSNPNLSNFAPAPGDPHGGPSSEPMGVPGFAPALTLLAMLGAGAWWTRRKIS